MKDFDKKSYDFTVVNAIAEFLNSDFEKGVTQKVESIMQTGVDDEFAVRLLIGEGGGIDTYGKDRDIFRRYFPLAIKRLESAIFAQDEYYKNLTFNGAKDGDFELCYQNYQKYEPFVADDLKVDFSGTVIPQIGFFASEFTYPAVMQKGRIWMTVTPNEINTMRAPISRAHGKVLALGLGLGYFAYHCSLKPNVESVSVVEISEHAIALFKKHILPQFSHPEKVQIIKADGFEFMKNPPVTNYDYVFCDLWHDVSDGLPMIEKLKPCQKNFPNAEFDYWIENSVKFYR